MKTPEELAKKYADKHALTGTGTIEKKCFLAGYQAGYESLRDQIQSLESQLRQANNMVMKLEAEK